MINYFFLGFWKLEHKIDMFEKKLNHFLPTHVFFVKIGIVIVIFERV
jgi:hypothetical protein